MHCITYDKELVSLIYSIICTRFSWRGEEKGAEKILLMPFIPSVLCVQPAGYTFKNICATVNKLISMYEESYKT